MFFDQRENGEELWTVAKFFSTKNHHLRLYSQRGKYKKFTLSINYARIKLHELFSYVQKDEKKIFTP